jgi:hypothetical protein
MYTNPDQEEMGYARDKVISFKFGPVIGQTITVLSCDWSVIGQLTSLIRRRWGMHVIR